jgi:hypothetical protein
MGADMKEEANNEIAPLHVAQEEGHLLVINRLLEAEDAKDLETLEEGLAGLFGDT